MMMRSITALLLFSFLPTVTGDKHSLEYLYTMRSKNSDPKTYNCTAVTRLNGKQIDFYNSSSDESRTDKQNWLNISESDWKTSTEKLKNDTQLLNTLIGIQMSESGHSHSGDHVLEWRHGCEGEQSSDGSLTVLNSINEFNYDKEDLIQFDCTSKTWLTPEKKKNREMEDKWSIMFKADEKCDQCKEMLKMYLKYKTTDITQSHTGISKLWSEVLVSELVVIAVLVVVIMVLCSVIVCVLIMKRRNRTGSYSASPSASSDSVLKGTGSDSAPPSASSDSDSVRTDSTDAGSPALSPRCNGDDALVHFSPGPDSTLPCKRWRSGPGLVKTVINPLQ